MLNLLLNNKNTMLKNIEEIRINNSTQKNDVLWFYNIIFWKFNKRWSKKTGYSKDGKFKEDQIVVGMVCDINGIPIFIKYFPETQVMLKHWFRF
ncbi:hypothetical protein NW064_03650 [Mycoplasmopsis felis]|uniref:hypothetical protein n=1 Tax=Mycoplasmopsis felis TaxID=33923 RepID=UPI0021AF7DD5|nr:hypothetical protein [Mycoplasmopsis felis]UWW00367.1 hypothetical protein NW064_03650 [Mycoplasmopsis felis]